ncbi:MAG: Uma2 family endonuclease, partial [Dehalococcoidia bacterium]
MTISLETFERVSLEDDDEKWELVCGHLRKKPAMTTGHSWVIRTLNRTLMSQLDFGSFVVDAGSARLYVSTGSYFMPDLCVIPIALKPVGD